MPVNYCYQKEPPKAAAGSYTLLAVSCWYQRSSSFARAVILPQVLLSLKVMKLLSAPAPPTLSVSSPEEQERNVSWALIEEQNALWALIHKVSRMRVKLDFHVGLC